MVKSTTTTKAQAVKKAVKKVLVPVHSTQVSADYRKNIIKSVNGKASSLRDESGKKMNRQHVLKYLKGDKIVTEVQQIIYGKQLLAHKVKNITELTNSKGKVYYFIPVSN